MTTDGKTATRSAYAVDHVYEEVRQRILDGQFPSGTHLKESEIAAQLGVSRTPVRSALIRLDAEGFVEVIPNRGTFVAQWSEVDLEEIFGLRIQLEAFGAKLAASKIDGPQIAHLRKLADDMDEALEAQRKGYIDVCTELNHEFHFSLLRATTNRRLIGLLTSIYELPLIHRTIASYSTEQLWRSWSQHRELIAAMESHDGDWADALMRAHLLASRDVTINAIAQGSSSLGRS